MKKNYIITYDIRLLEEDDKIGAKRLRKIAKLLENEAIRIQKSVFYLPKTNKKHIDTIVSKIEEIIDNSLDDVRIYTIKNNGYFIGEKAININETFILN